MGQTINRTKITQACLQTAKSVELPNKLICKGEPQMEQEEQRTLSQALKETSKPIFMQEQMQKKSHAKWCTNVEEDLGALGKHTAEKPHAVTAVWPFAKTGRKKGKRDLYQRNRVSRHQCISDTGQ